MSKKELPAISAMTSEELIDEFVAGQRENLQEVPIERLKELVIATRMQQYNSSLHKDAGLTEHLGPQYEAAPLRGFL